MNKTKMVTVYPPSLPLTIPKQFADQIDTIWPEMIRQVEMNLKIAAENPLAFMTNQNPMNSRPKRKKR